MFGLLKGLWNSLFEKPTLKILIIGLENAGKTVLFLEFPRYFTRFLRLCSINSRVLQDRRAFLPKS